MLYIWCHWCFLCIAFDVSGESRLWSVVWGLWWGLVWVLVVAFAKALAPVVSSMASCHDLGVWYGFSVKDLNASVRNMASFTGLFLWYVLMTVIGIMCQSYMLCFFIAYE
jgi:hypothetical protein